MKRNENLPLLRMRSRVRTMLRHTFLGEFNRFRILIDKGRYADDGVKGGTPQVRIFFWGGLDLVGIRPQVNLRFQSPTTDNS